jgi:PAS domain-containing protein
VLPSRKQKNLVLILGREFASLLATPVLITDADGKLVYFNEPAEAVLGTTFAEAGELPAETWSERFHVAGPRGEPLPLPQMPAGIAFVERRPAQGTISIVGLDGVPRQLHVTAIPLFAHTDEFVGVAAVFWEAAAGEDR